MKRAFRLSALLLWLLAAAACFAQQSPQPILPKEFSGWTQDSSSKKGSDPAVVDAANSQILKEYGFFDFETATYTRPDRKVSVKAARFQDAAGAYGAFTFWRMPQMLNERVGTMAASANERILFFRDNVVVEAVFDRVTAMSAAELRELAASLPAAKGTAANLPTLPSYFPRDQVDANSAKYVFGPKALTAIASPVNAALVNFELKPDIVLGKRTSGGSSADVMLIAYPTPQIAGQKLKEIEAANANPGDQRFVAKRTGPIVALVKGQISASDAKAILSGVSYEAEVTWNERTSLSKRDNIGNIVVAACILAGLIFLASVGTGAIFGFGRILLTRLFPQRYKDRTIEPDFISLDLKD